MVEDETSREAGLPLGAPYRDICWRSWVLLVILASWRSYAGEEPSNPRSSSGGTTLSRIKYTRRTERERQFLYMYSYYVSSICQHGVTFKHHAFLIFSASPPRPIHARLRLRLDAFGIVGSSIVPQLSLPRDNVLLLFTDSTTSSCFRGYHNWHAIFPVLYQTTLILLLL